MHQQHQRPDPDQPQQVGVEVGGLHFVEEIHALNARRVDERTSALERDADDANNNAVHEPDGDGKQNRQPSPPVHDVGGQIAKRGAGEPVAVLAAIDRMAPAEAGSRLSSAYTLGKFVVANRRLRRARVQTKHLDRRVHRGTPH